MSKIFEALRMQKPRYSAFDLSHEKKLSCEMGQLIPILCEEVVPGDHFKVSTEVMLRFAPLIAPIMHRVNVYVHYFYVPNRIIWDEWEEFITGGQQGTSTPTMPKIVVGSAQGAPGSLSDYLGIQIGDLTGGGNNPQVSALAYRAYTQIWNDYYRDETFQDEKDITLAAEVDDILTRCWEKDYYTSALPFTQRGAEIGVPLTFDAAGETKVFTRAGAEFESDTSLGIAGAAPGTNEDFAAVSGPDNDVLASLDNTDNLGITINDLRESSRLQEWLEKNARGGYRYIEQLLSHFGVKSSDGRLNRPEYMGGGRQPVVISEVLNTSATATEEQGTMAGHGISVGTANKAARKFEEHGWMIGILSVLPRTNYHQGIPRKFFRSDKLDYYFPEFAHLGEQSVLNQEIFADLSALDAVNQGVWGFQQRFAEYKYGCSTVHGDFRSTLDFWTMARDFTSLPALNEAFVESDPTERIFAVSGGDHIWAQVYNNVKARRPMPYFSNPKL